MSASPTTTEWILPVLTTAAIVGLTALPLLQSDAVSRYLLPSNDLQAKRCASYSYVWQKEARRQLLLTLREMGGDENLELLVHDGEINDFITKCLIMKNTTTTTTTTETTGNTSGNTSGPKLLCVGVDEELANHDVCLWIALDWRLYQVPLTKFGVLLADRMENIMTTTALCFVADASGGLGTDLITDVLLGTSDLLQVPVIREPTWVAQFAALVEDHLIMIQRNTLERCLFGLMRLEAHAVITKTVKTVCITLPGQATTAPLLPLLHAAFPCERHLFIYDGCTNVVSRSLVERSGKKAAPSSMRLFSSCIRHTTPLRRTLTKQIPVLASALQQLPLNHADTTECWMTSVDAMLQLKEDTAPTTATTSKRDGSSSRSNHAIEEEYLPFVCKVSLLLSTGTATERQMALLNLMQFVTGSRSRALPDGAVQQAEQVVVLQNYYAKMAPTSTSLASPALKTALEDCVFRHKSILLGDKTLVDTVLPTKEWSLKAAKKISGCACCGPEDDDDDDEYNPSMTANDKIDETDPLSNDGSKLVSSSSGAADSYVDGKMGFAFDPTKFG